MKFDQFIGVDYSGAKTADARSATLQVYSTSADARTLAVRSPESSQRRHRNWTRREITEYLCSVIESGQRIIVGIDHGFSFPISYFQQYQLTSWSAFLQDFAQHWPTANVGITVEDIRREQPDRCGHSAELRLTEKWTSSAKSVVQFDVQGSVAKSTHAGLPFLYQMTQRLGRRIHFWPFDGWHLPDDASVLAEVYPSLVRRRYDSQGRSADEQDAYSISRWLFDMCQLRRLNDFCCPPLTKSQTDIAALEGWILGVL